MKIIINTTEIHPGPTDWSPVQAQVPLRALQALREFELVDTDGAVQVGEPGDYIVELVGGQLVRVPRRAFGLLFKGVK
jgi:hypothetical protein